MNKTSYKVTVVSAWVGPRDHFFDDIASAEEFALAMRECQYKTQIEEIEEIEEAC